MTNKAILQSIREGEPNIGHLNDILEELKSNPKTIVVLDDDPTGTQTLYNVPVITQWTENAIENEIKHSPLFFILTNSRSLQSNEANELGKLLGERLKTMAAKHHKKLIVISRSDSTLRGHYPSEVDALAKGLGLHSAKHMLIPAFFEGGRYTFNDIHYVREGDTFTPAGETPFANDSTFGYKNSNLKDWIQEKTNSQVPSKMVYSFGLDSIRNNDSSQLSNALGSNHKCYIANATTYGDLGNIALACLKSNPPLIYRTAASFVNAIAGIPPKELLSKKAIQNNNNTNGGLVVIGSYVPKTTAQLNHITKKLDAEFFELNVTQLLEDSTSTNKLLEISKNIDKQIKNGKTVVVYTGRQVITGKTKQESLKIVNRVSGFLISIVKNLQIEPRFIIAKGGITSSDIAVKALNITRAKVVGQIIKGLPVWKLGNEAKFPNMHYIIFPGNVGGDDALYNLINKIT